MELMLSKCHSYKYPFLAQTGIEALIQAAWEAAKKDAEDLICKNCCCKDKTVQLEFICEGELADLVGGSWCGKEKTVDCEGP